MSISDTTNRSSFNGNGVSTSFPFAHPFFVAADLVVLLIAADGTVTTQILTTNYTVSGGANADGTPNTGTVTMLVAPASGATLVIYRDVPVTQPAVSVNNARLDVKASIEAPEDRLTLIAQRTREIALRTLHQPDSDTTAVAAIPAVLYRAGKAAGYDGSGNPIVSNLPLSAIEAAIAGMTSTSVSLPFLKVDSFIQPGDVDDTAALQRVAASINAAGGGTVWFSPRVYLVRTVTAGDVCDFVNCHGVTLLGFGATIQLPNRAFAGSEGAVFHFTACTNIYVDGFKGDGPHLDTTLPANPFPGYEFIRADQGCRGIRLGTNYIKSYIIALNMVRTIGDPESYRCQDIDLGNLRVENCAYGVAGQYCGDFMRGQLHADDTHRCFFVYGASNIDVEIWDKDHKDWSCLIGTANFAPSVSNIRIRYHKDTASTACSRTGCVWLTQGHTTVQTARNVQIELDVAFAGSGSTGGAAFMWRKHKDDSSSDDTGRGHVYDNFTVSGSITGQGSESGPGVTVGSCTLATDVNCAHWEGEVFRNLAFRDLHIAATDAHGAPFLILGGAADQIVLDGVVCNRDFAIYYDGAAAELPRTAKIVLNGVQCLNRFANGSDFSPPSPALDNIPAVATPVTVRAGWTNGKTVTNSPLNSDGQWNLPAALPGMKICFSRTFAAVMDVAPNGSETIGTGTGGQKLRLNAAGNFACLVCRTAGVWSLDGVVGAVSYV